MDIGNNKEESGAHSTCRRGGTLTANITALTSEGQQLAQWALEAWTEVTGINFSLATTTDANITFDDSEDGAGTLYTSLSDEGYILSAHVNVSEQWIHIHGEGMDSYAFTTYIHEIGHALGLGHPGPYNGDYPDFITDTVSFHDSWQTSVMSYIPQNQNIFTPANYATPVTPMIADIMAIHELYGAPASVNGGNTIYGYNANTGSYMDEYFRLWTGEGNPFAKTVDIHQPTFIGDYMVALSLDKRTIHFYENTGTATNPNFVHYDSVNWGDPIQDYQILDADRDGDLDAIIADNTGVYYVETNPESQIEILLSGTYTGKFEFVDIDGDSDYDVVEIFGNQVYTRENIGTPTELLLTDRIYEYTLHYNVSEFKFADLDGDNDYDFVAVDYYGGTYYYENEGSPTSPIYDPDGFQYLGNPLDSVFYGNRPKEIITDFAFADLDDDGDLDVFSIDNYSTVHYFKNVGTATNFNFIPTNFNRQTTLTLYDTDGTDLLDLRTDNHDQWIDLNPGAVSHVYGLEGNLVIAHDTIIEKLIAGRGNDIIFGNTANNAIIGFYGDDFLFGNDGNDTLKRASWR